MLLEGVVHLCDYYLCVAGKDVFFFVLCYTPTSPEANNEFSGAPITPQNEKSSRWCREYVTPLGSDLSRLEVQILTSIPCVCVCVLGRLRRTSTPERYVPELYL